MTHIPVEIKLLQKSRVLELEFTDGQKFSLSCQCLRAHSPSAEMKGNGCVSVKEDVNIVAIESVGQYAVKLIFDDGHETGIYSFDLLYELGKNQSF